jgi:hypothetical protein
LRNIVARFKDRYADARREDKATIADEIVRIIALGENGQRARFLKRETEDDPDSWVEVSSLVARDKVSHALRCKPKGSAAAAKSRQETLQTAAGSNGFSSSSPSSTNKLASEKQQELSSLLPSEDRHHAHQEGTTDPSSTHMSNNLIPQLMFGSNNTHMSMSTFEEQKKRALLMLLLEEEEQKRMILQRQHQQGLGLGAMPSNHMLPSLMQYPQGSHSLCEALYSTGAIGGTTSSSSDIQRQLLLSSAASRNHPSFAIFARAGATHGPFGGAYGSGTNLGFPTAADTQSVLNSAAAVVKPSLPTDVVAAKKGKASTTSKEPKKSKPRTTKDAENLVPDHSGVAALLAGRLAVREEKHQGLQAEV